MSRRNGIVTDYDSICAFCGRPADCTHHLIGGVNRSLADMDGLTIPVCNSCHNMGHIEHIKKGTKKQGTMIVHGNSMAETMSKMIGQLAYEKQFYRDYYEKHENITDDERDDARESFIDRYGRSYL